MPSAYLVVVPFVCALALSACGYEGDGQLTDNGFMTAHHRYVLDLGSVDLTRSERRTYRMHRLPEDELTFGFRLSGSSLNPKAVRTKVRLVLTNERNEVVFDARGSLSDWVWSHAPGSDPVFAYLRGQVEEVPKGKGIVEMKSVGVRADGGWGTYAAPRNGGHYNLLFETVEPDPTTTVRATLVAVGGGWK